MRNESSVLYAAPIFQRGSSSLPEIPSSANYLPEILTFFRSQLYSGFIPMRQPLKKIPEMPMLMQKTSGDESKRPSRLHDEMREGSMSKAADPAYAGKTSNMDSEYPKQSAVSGRNFTRYRREKKNISHGGKDFSGGRRLSMRLFSAF